MFSGPARWARCVDKKPYMTFITWLGLAGVCLLGALSPGPSLALVLRYSLLEGPRAGALAALTHGLSIGLYAALVLVGLGTVIQSSPLLFAVLKYGGALYLAWLAVKALRSHPDDISVGQQAASSWWMPCRDALAIAFLNPKIAIFFLALFSQFIVPGASWQTHLLMVATVGGIDALWYLLVSLFLAQSRLLAGLRANPILLARITGVVLLLLAVTVMLR